MASPKRPMVASAARLRINTRSGKRPQPQEWQKQAWDHYEIGEVKYALNLRANAMSKLRLFIGRRAAPDQPPESVDNAEAQTLLDALKSSLGAHPEIIRIATLNLDVAGECYLVGYTDPLTEQPAWQMRSVEDLTVGSDGRVFLSGAGIDGADLELHITGEGATDFILRIWNRHPRKAQMADSSLRGVADICAELVLLEKAVRAGLRSRASAGVFTVPDELSFGPADPTTSDPDSSSWDAFTTELIETLTLPIQDEASAGAVVPMFIRGPGEQMTPDKLRHFTFDRPLDAVLDTRTERALKRLAQGLNIPTELVLGLASSNHWSAWAIDEAQFRDHLEPAAVALCEALTMGYLRDFLPDTDLVIWYDPTALVTRPNRAQDAKDAHGALAISDQTLRNALGFTDDDAPSDEELLQRLAQTRGALDPALTQGFLQLLMDAAGLGRAGITAPGASGSPASPPAGSPSESGPPLLASGTPSDKLAHRLHIMDVALRERLIAATEAAYDRALERSGSRLRAAARKEPTVAALLPTIENRDVLAALGPQQANQVGYNPTRLADEMLEPLFNKFDAWVASTQASALRAVLAPTDPSMDARLLAQQQARASAWERFNTSVRELLVESVFKDAPSFTTIIREALAVAGGAQL